MYQNAGNEAVFVKISGALERANSDVLRKFLLIYTNLM
jgi:hypothetical protein